MIKKLFSILATAALTLSFGACSNDDIADNGTGTGGAGTTTGGVAFAAMPQNAGTRTSLDVTSSPKNFLWEIGDKIFVKDNSGVFHGSSNSVNAAAQSAFTFLVGGNYPTTGSYPVYYPGKNGTNDKVTITPTQTQAEPNSTKHFGEAGDNGIGTATWSAANNRYNFTLDHKAAYIAFKPYYVTNIPPHKYESLYLQKIEIISDNNITGTYDITAGGLTNETSGGNTLTLDLTKNNTYTYSGHTGNTYVQTYSNNTTGFKLEDTPNEAQSAAYAVIASGAHKLKVRYTIFDAVTQESATIEQSYGSFNFQAGHFKAIRAKVDLNKLNNVQDYSSWANNYYMWDAQKPYWDGYEWDKTGWTEGQDQPRISKFYGDNYPKSKTAAPTRWYNDSNPGYGVRKDAQTVLFKTLPNANEISWYVMKGDPHWDDVNIWTYMGHLYKGGMYFLKKTYISGYSDSVSPDGTDFRIQASVFSGYENNNFKQLSSNPIPPTDTNKYFFLPALGLVYRGNFQWVGNMGYYWSSNASALQSYRAYTLYFRKDLLHYDTSTNSDFGNIVMPFE